MAETPARRLAPDSLRGPAGARIESRHLEAFREALPRWFAGARRPMPWRVAEPGERDPYRVWVSEVMLQQTRVDQAGPYFERFIERFPTVHSLASAPLDDVLKAWEGLGYYARVRNLHRAAGDVVEKHGGQVPDRQDVFRSLPGVGSYTAAAVLSLAHGRPLAALDGNVIRVLTRVFGIADDVRSTATRGRLQRVADELLDVDNPGRHNEALMELGAVACTPRNPRCGDCPLLHVCAAARAGRPEAFPVVPARRALPHVRVAVGIVRDDAGRVLVQRRAEGAMLGGLWEFPGGKAENGETLGDTCRRELAEEVALQVMVGSEIARIDHAYSHFRLTLHAFECRVTGGEAVAANGQPLRWVAPESLAALAMPRANRRIVEVLTGAAEASESGLQPDGIGG